MGTMVASGKSQQSNTPPAASIFFNGQTKSVFNQNNSSSERASQETDPKRRLYRCIICGNAFTRWQALGGHKNIHRRYSAEILRAIQPEMSSPLPQGQVRPPEAAAPRKSWLRFRPAPSASTPREEAHPAKTHPKRRLDSGGGAVVPGWGNSPSSSCMNMNTMDQETKKTEVEIVPAEVDLELRLGPSTVDLQLRLGPTADQLGPAKLDPPKGPLDQ